MVVLYAAKMSVECIFVLANVPGVLVCRYYFLYVKHQNTLSQCFLKGLLVVKLFQHCSLTWPFGSCGCSSWTVRVVIILVVRRSHQAVIIFTFCSRAVHLLASAYGPIHPKTVPSLLVQILEFLLVSGRFQSLCSMHCKRWCTPYYNSGFQSVLWLVGAFHQLSFSWRHDIVFGKQGWDFPAIIHPASSKV